MNNTHTIFRILALGSALPFFATAQEVTNSALVGDLDSLVVEATENDEAIFKNNIVKKASSSATKTDTPLLTTPQSVSTVSLEELEMRGVRNTNEALAYSAGVVSEAFGMDSRADDIFIRGFAADSYSGNNYLDGMRLPTGDMWTISQFDIVGLQSIDVLKGPSAVLYGQVAPGGLVNRVSKRPQEESWHQLGASYDSFGAYKMTFDSTGSLNNDKDVLYRFVTAYKNGDTEVNHNSIESLYLAPSVTFKLAPESDLRLYAMFQEENGGSTFQFIPVLGTIYPSSFGRIKRSTFLGEPEFNDFERTQFLAGYEFNHRFNEVWSLNHQLRYSYVDTLYRAVIGSRAGLEADERTFNRRATSGTGTAQTLSIDTRLKAEFELGASKHEAFVGFDFYYRDKENAREDVSKVASIDVYNPVYSGSAGFINDFRQLLGTEAESTQIGLYVQDQMALNRWHLTLGGRYDFTNEDSLNTITDVKSTTDPGKFTGRAGLLYLFDNGIAPYASYATSFEPISGTDIAGNTFDPSEGRQFEIGLKYEPKSFDALFTLSAFDLTQKNILTANPDDPTFKMQTGEVNIRGLEFETRATLTESLRFIGNLTYLDSEITKSNDGYRGNEVPITPDFSASAWLDYTFANDSAFAGLGLGVGVRYVGERYGEQANSIGIPDYIVADAAIRYDLGQWRSSLEGAHLSLNVSNLTDKYYVAGATANINSHYGAGRIASLNLSYEW